ncbi:Putative tetratricopeptide-like helical domain superfamily [Septoria linicola]|uniref:Tetratricopeptide-like helical domain superfamily n=1 Tax=Septoria linicola TaxID=215465 RepID=A0A9Q9EQ32_9PEZI|nr:Putative tetratricopeptide-like helical domain superfamily [Septoria linicola]
MADPLSIATSALAIAELTFKVVSFIHDTKKGADSIDGDLEQLAADIEKLNNVTQLISRTFEEEDKKQNGKHSKAGSATADIRRLVESTLTDCVSALKELDDARLEIRGADGKSMVDKLRRHFKNRSKESSLIRLQQRIAKGHEVVQLMVTMLTMSLMQQSLAGTSASSAELKSKMEGMEVRLAQSITSLQASMRDTVLMPHEETVLKTAQSFQTAAWVNVYFMIPQAVSPMFMGREADLERLEDTVKGYGKERGTKRVVLHGLGGSGKTQFCCKFAQDNRPSFWGIFFIDALNAETVKSSYSDIAQRLDIQPSEANVKHYLSSERKPWLLIVDNADDHSRARMPEEFVPESESGIVLFTTRNRALISEAHFEVKFEGLDEERASTLLLTSARHSKPFKQEIIDLATRICHTLGFLPLSILHAGKAILKRECTLEDCLSFIGMQLKSVKEYIDGGRRRGSTISEAVQGADDPVHPIDETVYATFQLVIPAARREAFQFLQLLSFMESQRFPFQILLQAILSPQRQRAADKASKPVTPPPVGSQSKTMSQRLFGIIRGWYVAHEGRSLQPVLPVLLHRLKDEDPEDATHRLRGVLAELCELALLDYIAEDDTYCMHSSVHWWIRASMKYHEKAVWCQSACDVLSQAILLPPVGITDDDSKLRRQCVPHIQYVRKQERALAEELKKRQLKRQRLFGWPSVEPVLWRSSLARNAKFSIAYADTGEFEEARILMLGVDKYLTQALGLHNPIAQRVRLLLSTLYWWLTRTDEAVALQEELLAACRSSLGDKNVDTLSVREKLASTYWLQGKFQKAQRFAQEAVDGFEKAYPEGHVDTFQAMTTLGRCFGKLADFDRAVSLSSNALAGLRRLEKTSNEKYEDKILDVMDILAMAKHDRFRYGQPLQDDLAEAEILLEEALAKHRQKLGKEHPKSLWVTCNLARVKALRGDLDRAITMMREGVAVAERTIGPNHVGTLMGMTYFGSVLTMAGKLDEAEQRLTKVVAKYRARDNGAMHPDHLVAAAFLLQCYRRQNKEQDADRLGVEVVDGIRHIFGERSPWQRFFMDTYSVSADATAGARRDD